MEGARARNLALKGSGYDLPKSQPFRPTASPAKTPRAESLNGDYPVVLKISSVDELLRELRKAVHKMFCTADPSIVSASPYENFSRQAFRFFTTTNSITPEGFHHKVLRLGLQASRRLCLELFGRVDQEDFGEISYATFAHRIFLPEGYFNHDDEPTDSSDHASPVRSNTGSDAIKYFPFSQRPASAGASSQQSGLGVHPPRKPTPRGSGVVHGRGSTSARRASDSDIAVIYESMTLDELEKCVVRKLEVMIPHSVTDRARHAFRFFTKGEAMTFAEFHRHLGLLQIPLSPTKCRDLFVQLDRDRDGMIDFAEFIATLFNKHANTLSPARPNSARSTKRDAVHRSTHSETSSQCEEEPSMTTKQAMAKLRDTLDQQFSEETDRFQQAFKVFGKPSGISRDELSAAMRKLGVRLSDKQVQDVFDLMDFDKSGDLDLNEFVQGIMLDDNSTSVWISVKDRTKVEDSRRKLYSMAVQSVQDSWTIADIEKMLREKIEQRTSRSSDCFRQAFRIFKKANDIKPDEFHLALEAVGLPLTRMQADILFRRFDRDGSGDIDLNEFIHGVLPPDYTGHSWVAAADEMHRIAAAQKKAEALAHPDQYMTEIEMASWSLDQIEQRIRDKIMQSTSRSSDTFRQAYKIFKKSNHVTMEEFRERLLALGFRLTPTQCSGLFKRYDTDGSNDIDLQEFCMKILPPDYTADGDHWSHSEKYKKERQREKLEYVKRTKNGLIILPKFAESRRFTRGHYVSHTFEQLKDDIRPASSGLDDGNVQSGATRPTTPATKEEVPRPPTPRPPQPTRVPSALSTRTTSHHLLSPRNSSGSIDSSSNQAERPQVSCSPRKARATVTSPKERVGETQHASPSRSTSPTSPRDRPPTRPLSPRGARVLESSPQPSRRPSTPRKMYPRTPEEVGIEYEDEEVLDAKTASTSSDLFRVKRLARRRRTEPTCRRPLSARNDERESTSSRVSVRAAESVAGTSAGWSSTNTSRAVGPAKYTPQRNHLLLIKRFRQAAAKGADASRPKSATPQRRQRP